LLGWRKQYLVLQASRKTKTKPETMKKILFSILVLLVILIVTNCSTIKLANKYYLSPCYYDSPVKQSDFPQIFFEVDLNKYYQELKSLSSSHFSIDTVETIKYQNKKFPIVELTKTVESNIKNPKRLLVLAGVHGNESGGTLAILEFLNQYNSNPSKFDEWSLKIVTPINPAGTIEMSRYNECGCDLNRKVKKSSQKGIIVQRKIIESFKPDAVITLHEAPSKDFLIHSNKYLEDELLFKLLEDTEKNGIKLSTEDYLGQELKVRGNSKIKGHLKFLKNLVQVQALGDYASKRGIIEITTESGWNSQDTFQRVNSHVFAISSFIDNYQKKD